MPDVHEVSRDNSFERMLDEVTQRASVSNPEDTSKPEDSKESVMKMKEDEGEVQQPVHDTNINNEQTFGVVDMEPKGSKDEKMENAEEVSRCDEGGGCSEDNIIIDQLDFGADAQNEEKDGGENQGMEMGTEEERVGGDEEQKQPSPEIPEEAEEDMEEKRFQEERKRKGKKKAPIPQKKKKVFRPASRTVTIREPNPAELKESDSDESSDSNSSFYAEG